MILNYQTLEPTKRYKYTSQTVVPRPIAWIVTQNGGVLNIAPFSYFTPLSSNPPTMVVSIGHKKTGAPKDTLKNIRETKKCTICMVDFKDLKKMDLSASELDESVSEADEFDIETKIILKEFPPMVKNSQVAFFCEFLQEIDLKQSKTIPLILKVNFEYIDDSIIKDDTINYAPVARVGAGYAKFSRI